jgi:hypothetical protein
MLFPSPSIAFYQKEEEKRPQLCPVLWITMVHVTWESNRLLLMQIDCTPKTWSLVNAFQRYPHKREKHHKHLKQELLY